MSASKAKVTKKIESTMLIAIFLISLTLPLAVSIFQPDKKISIFEKRRLNQLPPIPRTIPHFLAFPERFDDYYADQFGFREMLGQFYYKIDRRLNSGKTLKNLTIGKDDWLFLGSNSPGFSRFNDPIGDYLNINRFTPDSLRDFGRSIEATHKFLENQGIRYLFVIAPNKHTIYPDKLPDSLVKQHPTSATDQLLAYLRESTKVTTIDLRPALRIARQEHEIYFRYDSHWNQYGANIAQYEIIKPLENWFPNSIRAQKLPWDRFKIQIKKGGDLATLAKQPDKTEKEPIPTFDTPCDPFAETAQASRGQTQTVFCESAKHSVLIFRDSFFTALQPYVSRHFHRATYVWNRLHPALLKKHIADHKPDVVIEELVERLLPDETTRNTYE